MSSSSLRLECGFAQRLAPSLQQAVRLLQLTTVEFYPELQRVIDTNPFLDSDETDTPEPGIQAALASGQDPDGWPRSSSEAGHDDSEAISAGEYASKEEFDGLNFWHVPALGSRGLSSSDIISGAKAPTSIREYLQGQVGLLKLSSREQLLARLVAESIDNDGYLRSTPDDLLELTCEMEPPASESEIRQAIAQVQAAAPPGIASRNVAECLTLQLQALPRTPDRDLALRIVAESFDHLIRHDGRGLALKLAATPKQVEAAYSVIQHLDPHPDWQFKDDRPNYVVPDVLAYRVNHGWQVRLNPEVVPRIRINETYAALYRRHRNAAHAELSACLNEARWTLRNTRQRFATIERVAQAIAHQQQDFFQHGELALRPLALQDIADRLGMNASTVSRATSGKYLATSRGVFELKYFFSRSLPTRQGNLCATEAVRHAIAHIIRNEDGDHRLSDPEVAGILQEQGLRVARRTVTKYRQAMRIASVSERGRAGTLVAAKGVS